MVRENHSVLSKQSNRTLTLGKQNKQDEFYTQLVDIENELKHYKDQLRGKVIFCNCDDPYESNFFKYFAKSFNSLGLKKLIATSYCKSPIVGGQLHLFEVEGLKPEGKEPYKIEINEVLDLNNDGAIGLDDVEYLLKHDRNVATPLESDNNYSAGDFRSDQCVELLKQADVVITNPPFSLFREYVSQLVKYNKQYLIIGNTSAITYSDVFKLIKDNKLWLGINNGSKTYKVPDNYVKDNVFLGEDGNKYAKMGNTGWFTNLDVAKRHEFIPLFEHYSPEKYPRYDNYDAIEVSKVAEIPVDYFGAMGVPVSFLDKHDPDQFEILGITDRYNMSGLRTKQYTAADSPRYNDLNRRGVIKVNNEYKLLFARILIKRKDKM